MKKVISLMAIGALVLSMMVCFSGCGEEAPPKVYRLEIDYVKFVVDAQMNRTVWDEARVEDFYARVEKIIEEMEYVTIQGDTITKQGRSGKVVEGDCWWHNNLLVTLWEDGTTDHFAVSKETGALYLPEGGRFFSDYPENVRITGPTYQGIAWQPKA